MEEDYQPATPYPEDPTAPFHLYRLVSLRFEEPEPDTHVQQKNITPAAGPNPNPPNPPNPNPFVGPAVIQQPHASDKELWINLPKPFNGDRKKYKEFQNAVVLYLGINRHIYNDDEKKIGFILSYLNDKEAAQW